MKNVLKLICCTTAAAMATAANAATVASYSFDTDAEGWLTRNGSVATGGVVDANFGSSPVLQVTNGVSSEVRAYVDFGEITLVNIGDFLQVDYSIRVTANIFGDFRRIEAAFYDSDGANPNPGYSGMYMLAGTFGNRIYEDDDFSESVVISSTATQVGSSDNSGTLGGSTTAVHPVTLRVERTAAGVDVTYTTSAGSITRSDNVSPYYTFDTVDLGTWGSTQINFNIDNVVITTNVPEPGSLALVTLGGLTMLRRRR